MDCCLRSPSPHLLPSGEGTNLQTRGWTGERDMLQRSFFRLVLAGLVLLGFAVVAVPTRADEAADLQRDSLPAHAIWLDSLDLSKMEQGWKKPQACRSVDEHAIKIHGTTFPTASARTPRAK